MNLRHSLANFLGHRLQEIEVRGTVGLRLRSEHSSISGADVVRIENTFQKDPKECLELASAKQGISVGSIRKVLHEKLEVFRKR